MLLLLTIGLKGGVELAQQSLGTILPQMLAVLLMGIVQPLIAFPILLKLAKFKRVDAASIAAHYGSVSVATYAVGVAVLNTSNISFEPQMPLFLVLLEMPAIVVGIILARGISAETRWGELSHEIFLGKSIVLLLGGLFIGWIAGPENLAPIKPLFFDLFKGVLALFLLEMGLIAASQAKTLRNNGLAIILFGLLIPVPFGCIGVFVGMTIGLSVGGTALLAVLAGSASYIAVPAAMRIALPSANPTLSLAASLGVTFPFNIFIGIPVYIAISQWAHAAMAG